jgi:hypothetical protein
MKSIRNILIFALFLSCCGFGLSSQSGSDEDIILAQHKKTSSRSVFKEIEDGIVGGNVSKFSAYFSSQTYLSLSNGASGYYSANQAFYVLQDYFKVNKVSSFRFQTIYEEEETPFATGVYTHEFRGRKSVTQVFVSLKFQNGAWKITQMTFN